MITQPVVKENPADSRATVMAALTACQGRAIKRFVAGFVQVEQRGPAKQKAPQGMRRKPPKKNHVRLPMEGLSGGTKPESHLFSIPSRNQRVAKTQG